MAYDDAPAEGKKFEKKLWSAVANSRKGLKPFLDFRKNVFATAGGFHYDASVARQPINKIKQALDVYPRLLFGRYPKVEFDTKDPDLAWVERAEQERMYQLMKQVGMQETMRLIIKDAIALFGVSKSGISGSSKADRGDNETDLGEAYFSRVSPDYFVYDLKARNWESCQFQGDLVERDLEYLLESGLYDDKFHDSLRRQAKNEQEKQNVAQLGRKDMANTDGLYDRVCLWEIYLPKEQKIVTMLDGGVGGIIREQEYEGPEDGLYEMLSFESVPDNIVPMSPAMGWYDLNELTNFMLRKFRRQAERQKSLTVGIRGSENDAETVRDADDGEYIMVQNPEAMKELSLGGIDQKNFGFEAWSLSNLNMLMGNLDMISGIGTSADTASQERMLADAAGGKIQDMRREVEQFLERNIRKLWWYDMEDPETVHELRIKYEGVDFPIRQKLAPKDRNHNYELRIIPGSLAPRGKAEEMQEMQSFVANVIMPLTPMMQQQGMLLDMPKLIEMFADALDLPGLKELIHKMDEPPQPQGGGQYTPTKSPTSTRNYVRTQQTVPSQQDMDQQAMNMMSQGE